MRALGIGRTPGRYPESLITAYRELLDDPSTVEAICEDYRAGATLDREHDDADRGKRRIECPLLLLWSSRGALPRLYGDVLEVWRPWADSVTGRGLDATHFLVEDQPEEVAQEILALLSVRQFGCTFPTTIIERLIMTTNVDSSNRKDDLTAGLQRTEIQRHDSSIPGRDHRSGAYRDPGGGFLGLAQPPRRRGGVHRRGLRSDGDQGPTHAAVAGR